MPTNALVTRNDLATKLTVKAWKDAEFRKAVTSDPKKLLEEQLGRKLPEDLRIFVHEEDEETLHFSILPAPAASADLSDEDLEKVAGGTEITLAIFGTVLAGAAVTGAVATGVVVGVKQGW